MIFTQKRERFVVSEDDRTSIHERILASLEFPKAAMPGMLLFQEIYGVEEIIRYENAMGFESAMTDFTEQLRKYHKKGSIPYKRESSHYKLKSLSFYHKRNIISIVPICITD